MAQWWSEPHKSFPLSFRDIAQGTTERLAVECITKCVSWQRAGGLVCRELCRVVYLGIRDWIKPCGGAGAFFILSQKSDVLSCSTHGVLAWKRSFGAFRPVQEARGLNERKKPRWGG